MNVESRIDRFNEIILDGNLASGEGASDEGVAKSGVAIDGQLAADNKVVGELGGGVNLSTISAGGGFPIGGLSHESRAG